MPRVILGPLSSSVDCGFTRSLQFAAISSLSRIRTSFGFTGVLKLADAQKVFADPVRAIVDSMARVGGLTAPAKLPVKVLSWDTADS